MIRNRLRMLGWAGLLLVLVAVGMAAGGYRLVRLEKSYYDDVEWLRDKLVNLNVITMDMLYDTAAALQPGQWRLAHESVGRRLASLSQGDGSGAAPLVELHRKLGERMSRFLDARASCARGSGDGDPELCRELLARLATQVRLVLQDLFVETGTLERQATLRLDRYFYLGALFLFGLLLALALLTVTQLMPVARRLDRGLGGLVEAANRFSKGELEHRVEDGIRDELGVLATAFNEMAQRRKAVEEALRRNEANLAEAQQVAHVGSWELDLVRNRLWWSDEIYRIFEIDPRKFGASYEAFLERVHPADREKVDDAYRRSVADRTSYEIVHRLLLDDGRVKYVHERGRTHYTEDGTPLRSIGTVQDVTDQELANRALKESERELDAIIENLPLMVFLKDAEQLRYVRFNRAGEELLGISREQVLGRTDHELFPAEQAEAFVREDRRVLKSGQALDVTLEPIDTVHGRRFLHTRKVCICSGEGRPRYLLGISEDITQRVEAENRIRYRLSLEAAMAHISTELAQAGEEMLDAALDRALEEIGRAVNADRSYLFQLDPGGETFTNTHEWCLPGIASQMPEIRQLPVAEFEAVFRLFRKGEILNVSEPSELVGISTTLRDFMEETGIRSLVNVPVLSEGELLGIIGFDAETESRHWPEEDVRLLRIVAEAVAGALMRMRATRAIREHTWYLEGLDRVSRALAEHTTQQEMLWEVVDLVLELFQADRAWMLQAAPDEEGFEVPIERTRPEYPGAIATGLRIPDDEFGRRMMEMLLAEREPVVMQMAGVEDLPDYMKSYGIRSQMLIAIRPSLGTPWILGIHQCSREREWSAVERRLFQAIAERVAISLVGVRLMEEIRQSERRLQEAEKIAQVGTWELDLKSGRAYWSDQEYRCLGYEPGTCEAGYEAFARAVHPDDLERVKEAMERAVRGETEAYEIQHRVIWQNGSEHVVHELGEVTRDPRGEAVRMIGTTQDITRRVQLEQELERHRRHLEQLVEERTRTIRRQTQIIEQTNDSVVTTDLEGRVTSWNGGAVRVFGYSVEEAMGRHIGFVYPEGNEEVLRELITRPLLEKGTHETEVVLRRKDGTLFPAFLSLSLLYDETGTPEGMVGYAVDISELKRREEELRQLAERLEASNRELESFSYSVSHDLRAPLRAIDGFSQALVEDYADRLDGAALDYLGRIRNGAQRLGTLIDDLLQLSRVNRGELQLQRVDLAELARSVMEELRAGEPERKVELLLGEEMVVTGDPRLLRAMVANLLGNAWKFTNREEYARIVFRRMEEDPRVFYVQDNGVGFDMRHADKLFGAFQRLHRVSEFPGTGVGLATVQRIVHRHGGRVWAEAEPGKGATFYFSLDPGVETPPEPADEGTET